MLESCTTPPGMAGLNVVMNINFSLRSLPLLFNFAVQRKLCGDLTIAQ